MKLLPKSKEIKYWWFNLKRSIKKHPYPLILLCIGSSICILNFTYGTWQTGWDTLHPEFNWRYNFPRHMLGMWQDNQGLGNVGGHSHAADTSRLVTLFFLDLIFPKSILRYLGLFITFLAGPLGTYYFLKDIVFGDLKNRQKARLASFVGALYYMLNLGTVQQFYVPLEMYTYLYGFLPWVFLYTTKFILKGSKYAIHLAIAVILATPLAYAITVFMAFYLCLVAFTGGVVVTSKFWKHTQIIKNFIWAHIIIISLNLYWLLPSLYFAFKHGDFVSESRINSHFSQDIFLHNVSHGKFKDLFLLKGFLVNWRNYDFINQKFYFMMTEWNQYFLSPGMSIIEYILIGLIIFGLLYSVIRRSRFALALIGLFLICVFMIMTINPPFGWLFSYLRENISLFRESLRNPYTKFSVELMFVFAAFVSFSALGVFDLLQKMKLSHRYYSPQRLVLYIFTIFFVIYMLPVFGGSLVSKDVRIDIPDEYFSAYEWLNSQEDNRRVATLPVNTFWGWQYLDWGYQGAGFIWFGAKQPFLERDFDRWNEYNETYFNEMSSAIYANDIAEVDSILKKYGIGYVLLDKNAIAAGYNQELLALEQIEKILQNSTLLSKPNIFGDIYIYKVLDGLTGDFSLIEGQDEYIVSYPYAGLLRTKESMGVTVDEQNESYSISRVLDIDSGNYTIEFNDQFYTDDMVPSVVKGFVKDNKLNLNITPQLPIVALNGENITNEAKPINIEFSINEAMGDLVLNINEDYFFDLSEISEIEKDLGYILINTGITNYFNLNQKVAEIPITYEYLELQDCSSGDDSRVEQSLDHLSIWSFTDEGCVERSIDVSPGNYVVHNEYKYKTLFGESPSYCIQNGGLCQNAPISYDTKVLPDKYSSISSFTKTYSPGNILVRLSSPKGSNGVSNIEYIEFIANLYKEADTKKILPSEIEEVYKNSYSNVPIAIESGDKLEAKIPKSLKYAVSGADLYDLSSLSVSKNGDTSSKEFKGGIELTSRGVSHSLFESIDMKGIPNNMQYLMSVKVKESIGVPLIIEVRDKELRRHYIYERMSSLNDTYILPYGNKVIDPEKKGYVVGIINSNIGESTSSNLLQGFELVPYPGRFIEGISINSAENYEFESTDVDSEAFLRAKKLTPFAYFLKTTGTNKEYSLVFNQSYEDGWGLLLGEKEHTLYNGWANLFRVNSAYNVLFFKPAMLQIFGYLIFALSMGIICYKQCRRGH